MIKHHPGACPAHYSTHLLTHRRLVAMDRTPLASTLVVTELAALKPRMSILKQFKTGRAHIPVPLLLAAIERNNLKFFL